MQLVEVCVDSLESSLAAVNGGASRLELCSALSEGGLTPFPGLLRILKQKYNVNIPIYCMLRPNNGCDFVYNEDQMEIIIHDMELLNGLGADGFVFGSLNRQSRIDEANCRLVTAKAVEYGSKPVTFHRAFDYTNPEDFETNIDLISSMGFTRILTSGYKNSADQGMENIKKLVTHALNSSNKIIIMPGSGVNEENILHLLNGTGCAEIHGSFKMLKEFGLGREFKCELSEENVFVTDEDKVKKSMMKLK